MKREKYSNRVSSALRVLFIRAWDNSQGPEIRVCHDTVAVKLVRFFVRPFVTTGIGRKLLLRRMTPLQIAIMGYIPLRTRLIDDCVQAAIEGGLEQLVILGAGYDTRAYRFDELRNRTKAFEVDRAEMQVDKKARLKKAFGSVPDHVTYVQVDFETDDLSERLRANGYDANLTTFFILEGVTYFLDAEAVDRTLAFVAEKSGPRSVIMFDYVPSGVVDGTNKNPIAADLLDAARQLGEPYKFGIEPTSIATFLSQRGFSSVEDYSVHQLVQRYHGRVNRDRPVMDVYHVVRAIVRQR